MNREELAWAAGLFDGEGHSSPRYGATRIYQRVDVGQKNREVLDRFAAAVGVGKVSGPHVNAKGHIMYRYAAYGFEKTQAIAAMLWSWLSRVKKEQFRNTLTAGSASR